MFHIEGISGRQYLHTDPRYSTYQEQYASSTYQEQHDLRPGLIVLAENIHDVSQVVRYAKANKVAIAIRSGGHQYSGASSTSQEHIQLDLRQTFTGAEDLKVLESGEKTLVRASVSWSVGELVDFLASKKLFVPTGQCAEVCLGGHVQTGGYGQLIRSFGLLGDHVVSIELIDTNGDCEEVTRSKEDKFYALLGGSPGNLGVLTHFTLEVYRDTDYDGSLGLLAIHRYSRHKLTELLGVLAKMSDSEDFPRNYDLCITVRSRERKLRPHSRVLDQDPREGRPEGDERISYASGIVVFAQWVRFRPDDVPDTTWFDNLNKDSVISKGVQQLRMSKMVKMWLFKAKREFNRPYVKRTLSTSSSTLSRDRWPIWISNHIDKIYNHNNGLFISAQMQCFGGKFSRFATNADNGTSYSWRDSRLGCTIDCFHEDGAKNVAEQWQKGTDKMIGPQGVFAAQERRQLWGSFGDWHMDKMWQYYYDSAAKYQRLQRARSLADPVGIFTPNPFCVTSTTVNPLNRHISRQRGSNGTRKGVSML